MSNPTPTFPMLAGANALIPKVLDVVGDELARKDTPTIPGKRFVAYDFQPFRLRHHSIPARAAPVFRASLIPAALKARPDCFARCQ